MSHSQNLGQQWLKNAFDYKPRNGWSIDVFGHGAAVPYLLRESGIDTAVIQRVHFAWKQWLAEKQSGDFNWRQVGLNTYELSRVSTPVPVQLITIFYHLFVLMQMWDASGETDVLTHNRPYDIYSIKHSCGPHPQTCLNFDFRKVC